MQEIWVPYLGLEDPQEKGMAAYSSILAWRILWTEEPGGLQSIESQRVRHDWVTNTKEKQKPYSGDTALTRWSKLVSSVLSDGAHEPPK